jgi:hypothetical protein
MSTEHDTTRIVRSWLRTDEHESAARVLDDVLDLLDATPQRQRVRPVRRSIGMDAIAGVAIAAAAAIGVVMVAGNLPTNDASVGRPTIPAASAPPSPTAAPSPRDARDYGDIDPGGYDIAWPLGPSDARIHLTVPAGWAWMGQDRATIYKDHGRLFGFPADLSTHAVSRVVTSVCALDESSDEVGPTYADVGPTVDDLTTAISNVVGTHWSAPADVTIGGYPAKRLVSRYSADCPGPARRWIWESDAGAFFVEQGARSSIYVVDVDGLRLVITTQERTSSPDVTGELDAIVSSVEIDRGQAAGGAPTQSPMPTGRFPSAVGPDADLRVGRHEAIVEGVPFSFDIPAQGWEPQLGFYISKSNKGPQGAEGTIRWTTVPDGQDTDACPKVLDPSVDRSAGDVAAAVVTAPGVDAVTAPREVTVGGRTGMHVVITVRQDLGCDPGYFYAYKPVDGGALWTDTQPGDTIMVWVVDVGGTLLFMEGELHADAGPKMVLEMQQIIDSIRFE